MTTEPDFYPDPTGLFVARWHDGVEWTPYVVDSNENLLFHEVGQPAHLLAPGWYNDPFRVFIQRFYDGTDFTDQVIDNTGRRLTDPAFDTLLDVDLAGPAIAPAVTAHRHAFLSYAREDRWYVDNLVGHLHVNGIPTWSDAGIEHGSGWEEAIEVAMHQAFAVVLVVSEAAKRSRWVKRELYLADQLHLPVLPLLLDGAMWWRVGDAHHEDVGGGRLPGPAYVQQLHRWAAGR